MLEAAFCVIRETEAEATAICKGLIAIVYGKGVDPGCMCDGSSRIMKITGHSSPATLKKYIRAKELEVVDKIVDKYSYFD